MRTYFKEWEPTQIYSSGNMLKLCMDYAGNKYNYSYE
jgi:hypothetical protein